MLYLIPGAGMSFISADFVKSLGLKTQSALKLAVRVASGQRQRSTQQVEATVKVGKQICTMNFRALRQLRVAPLVLGLQQLKQLDVSVHLRTGLIHFPDGSTVQSFASHRRVQCNVLEPARFAKMLSKFKRVIMKQHGAESSTEFFLLWISTVETENSLEQQQISQVTTDFGETYTQKLKVLLTEHADVFRPLSLSSTATVAETSPVR